MHRAAAATIPMTIPVVLLDSRTTSEVPGTRLTPGSVGSAVGILRNIGEVIIGLLESVPSTSKDVGYGSNTRLGWGFSLRILKLPAVRPEHCGRLRWRQRWWWCGSGLRLLVCWSYCAWRWKVC